MVSMVERARRGEGPFFVVLNTYRFHGHHVGDINRTYYRSKEEERDWRENRDPIKNFGHWLIQEQVADENELKAINGEVLAEAEAAVEYALLASYPNENEVNQHVFVAN